MSAEGRVENQKLNQTAALLSFGWVFGFQLDWLEKNVFTLAGFTFTGIKKIDYTYRWALQGDSTDNHRVILVSNENWMDTVLLQTLGFVLEQYRLKFIWILPLNNSILLIRPKIRSYWSNTFRNLWLYLR